MGRPASGVQGMRLRGDDEVIEVDIATDDADLLVVTKNGWGKRTRVSDYPVKGRGRHGRQDGASSSRARASSPARTSSARASR